MPQPHHKEFEEGLLNENVRDVCSQWKNGHFSILSSKLKKNSKRRKMRRGKKEICWNGNRWL